MVNFNLFSTATEEEDITLDREESSVSSDDDEDNLRGERDLYGQRHPTETPEMIAEGMLNLEKELLKIPKSKKINWSRAEKECPGEVGHKFKLMFLRCEVFNAGLAAARIIRFWNMKEELFADKAFVPMTIEEAFGGFGIKSPMRSDAIQLVPAKDRSGRGIIFVDPSKVDTAKCDRNWYRQANCYVMMAAIEDESVQKKGLVVLFYPPNAEANKFDRKLLKKVLGGMKGTMPVRISVFHVCQIPSVLKFFVPVFKLIMGSRLRQRMKFHNGSTANILRKLGMFELSADELPTQLGGNIVLDHPKWVEERWALGL